jgi:serine protease
VLSRALIAAAMLLVAAAPALAADEFRDQQWGLAMVHAEEAWPTSTGVGAVVAVIDTGVQRDHPDLGGRLVGGFDYVGNDPEGSDTDPNPEDGNGHGTHVTGIIAANRDNSEGIAGVAPGARVMPIRVLDDNGEGFADDTIKGIDYAIDHGAHVINLSLGDFVPLQSTVFPDRAYEEALERALDAGIVVVLAAGNNGFVKCENPDVEDVLCVGAVDRTPMRAMYSSFGSNVDLMAPGGSCLGGSSEDVLSTVIHSDYDSFCGTSQAAPHVAGVAALLVSLGLKGQAATDRIIATAADSCIGLPGECSAGVVDAAAAVEGLSPPGGGPGDPDAAKGSFSTKRRVKRRAVRRHGFRVKCKAARPGECRIRVNRKRRRIARGRDDVPADIRTRVTAELNRKGKRALKHMGRRLRVKVIVTLPGEEPQARRVTVRR